MIRNRSRRDHERHKLTRRQFGLSLAAAAMGTRVLSAADADYTVVVVPDTQYMAYSCGQAFNNTTQWIVNNLNASQGGMFTTNIKAVIGVGDCAHTSSAAEFNIAKTAYQKLDSAGVTWVNPPGNHDYVNPTDPATARGAGLGSGYKSGGYFAADQRQAIGAYGTLATGGGSSAWGGSYDSANYYVTLVVGSRKLIIFSVEYLPRAAVLTWAKGVHDANPGYECIVTTHSFLADTGVLSCFTSETNGGYANDNLAYGLSTSQLTSDANANSGIGMWNSYLNVWDRLTLVLNGHFFWNSWHGMNSWHHRQVPFTSASSRAQTVQSIFCNWQEFDGAGDSDYASFTGNPATTNASCTTLGSTYRIGHLMLLQFRPSIGKMEGYALSTNTGLWEPTLANPNTLTSTPQLLFSVDYPGVTSVATYSSGISGRVTASGGVTIR